MMMIGTFWEEVKNRETFQQAICRELNEEAGIEFKKIMLFGVYNNFLKE